MKRLVFVVFASLGVSATAQDRNGSITGDVQLPPGMRSSDTVVYIKRTATVRAPRQLTLDVIDDVTSPVVATVGDTVVLHGDHELKPFDASTAPLGIIAHGGERRITLAKEGIYWALSSKHSATRTYLFIGQNPFLTTVDQRGHFVIADVPPGDYELAVWNPWIKASTQPVRVEPGVVSVNFILRR